MVRAALDAIDEIDPRLNSVVARDDERALAAATDLDRRLADREDPGPLVGVPLLVKDLEEAEGWPTSHGSVALSPEYPQPAAADSIHVARLRAAGAIVVGKTNTPELGWTAATTNPRFPPTRNPWDPTRSPGGSSGGSAAAVAAGLVPLATGSDGGGSIRIPSALCGISGFKPSLGRVPHGGLNPPPWLDLDSRGPMARTTEEIALALDVVIGPDPTDLRSLPRPEPSFAAAVSHPGLPKRVAWSPTLGYADVDSEVLRVCNEAVARLAAAGAEVDEVENLFPADPVFSWLSLVNAYLARSFEGLSDVERERIDPGLQFQMAFTESDRPVDLVRAEDECHRLNLRLVDLFHGARVLLCPTTAATAPLTGEPGVINGSTELNWVRFTYPFNMTRSPAGTVCAGYTSDGLPVGLQVIGPQHADLAVLRAMAAFEEILGNRRRPPL